MAAPILCPTAQREDKAEVQSYLMGCLEIVGVEPQAGQRYHLLRCLTRYSPKHNPYVLDGRQFNLRVQLWFLLEQIQGLNCRQVISRWLLKAIPHKSKFPQVSALSVLSLAISNKLIRKLKAWKRVDLRCGQ